MRWLVYGLQSSGASLFSYFLAQAEDAVAVIDLRARRREWLHRRETPVAPALEAAGPVVVKCVVTARVSFEQHRDAFRPDRSILFLREPCANLSSLRAKPYARHGGSIDAKLALLEHYQGERHLFDAVFHCEDFVADPAGSVQRLRGLGWPALLAHYDFPLSLEEVVRRSRERSDWCDRTFGKRWGTGHARGRAVDARLLVVDCAEEDRARVAALCPGLLACYAARGGAQLSSSFSESDSPR